MGTGSLNILNQDLIGYYGNLALLICRNVSENKFAYILQKLLDTSGSGRNPTSVATRLNYALTASISYFPSTQKIVRPSDQKVYFSSVSLSFLLLLLGWRTWRLSENLNFKFKVFFLIFSRLCFLSRAPPPRTQLYRPADDERARHWKPEQILAETTHKCNAFSTSPERFITVIKVLFANTLQRKVSPRVRTVSSTEDKSPPDFCRALERQRLTSFCFFSFYFYRGGHRQTRIISSNRLRAGNKLLHLSMKMIEQKDDKRRAAHLSKLFTRGAKSQLLDPLEKLLCYSYNLSLTCCIY